MTTPQKTMKTTSSKVVALLFTAALFLLFVGQADSIVCPPGYCEQQQCKQVDEATCDGIVKPNATFCQCCPACIKLLGENDSCFALQLRGGSPPKAQCSDGLYCDPKTTTCTPIP